MDRLIHRLAEAANTPPGEVADNLDKLLTRIRRRLRSGRPVRLPGLGTLEPGQPPGFRQEDTNARHGHGRTTRPDR